MAGTPEAALSRIRTFCDEGIRYYTWALRCIRGAYRSVSRSIPTTTSERPVLLAVDQKLGEGATPRIAPELVDPLGTFEVGQQEDVEKFGAARGTEGVQAGA